MAKRKPDSTDAYLAELRAKGVEFTEGRTAAFPEIVAETTNTAISPGVQSGVHTAHATRSLCSHPPRKSKYGAIKTTVDGITFDSKKEARRYLELKHQEATREIFKLELQPKFDLAVNGVKVGVYRGDFRYLDYDGNTIVEDCKGMKTPVYRLKAKLLKAIYGITILET